jgi:predicted metal-dependent hydrolase
MSTYTIDLPDIGSVKVTKKRGMRSIRMRITAKGDVAVSAPWYVGRETVQSFVLSKSDWLVKNQPQETEYWNGRLFGKSMRLQITEYSQKQRSRIGSNILNVYVRGEYNPTDLKQKEFIEKAMIRALQREAEESLLPRLYTLSVQYDYEFNQAFVKHLTSRWGSCDQSRSINLSLFLIQLPWELIDYVLIHELTHTRHMNHSPSFWKDVEKILPDYKRLRKEVRAFRPTILN